MSKLQEEAKKKTAEWITKEYGPRCKVLSHGCPCCDMWKLYDVLFADIDGEYTWSKKIRNTPDDKHHNDKSDWDETIEGWDNSTVEMPD